MSPFGMFKIRSQHLYVIKKFKIIRVHLIVIVKQKSVKYD